MTPDEIDALDKLADAWNAFNKLPELHPDDKGDFRHAVHQAQNIVMARVALREINAHRGPGGEKND